MCGISGFNWEDKVQIRKMNACLKHRGPDDSGFFSSKRLSFGQARLSIIDLSPAGHQPMFYDKRLGASSSTHNKEIMAQASVGIVFNGEIYNFQELKTELEAKKYFFSTKSDTEVILASYLEWGFDCTKKFNGMWAFCIYDRKKQVLFCSRDRLGVKPFYYYLKDGKFIFASELKSILSHKGLTINRKDNINIDALNLYFGLGYIPAPYTIYNSVFKLEARHSLVFDLKKSSIQNEWCYYDIPDFKPVHDKKKLIAEGRQLLKDAVRLRMIADVPVGAFLSGGLDSSTIVGEMKELTDISKLHTFSIGFEGKYDESKFINLVKDFFHTKHHHFHYTEKDFTEMIRKHATIYDEPFGDCSGFPTAKLAELARKDVTVALSGDGGDEIFGGYNIHKLGAQMDLLRLIPFPIRYLGASIPAKKRLDTFASAYLLKNAFKMTFDKPEKFFTGALKSDSIKSLQYDNWTESKLRSSLKKGGGKLGEALRIYDLLHNSLADNFLVKVDRASMAHALEVRSPFLDYRFIAFSQKIPSKWKTDIFRTKILMREMIKDIVPEAITKRKKQGFVPPIDKWILGKRYASSLSSSAELLKDIDAGLYQIYTRKILVENNRLYNNYKIRLMLFGLWWKRWIS